MNFCIISIEVNELYDDSAWSPHYVVDLNLDDGEILFRENVKINKKLEYEIELKYYEESEGEKLTIEYLDIKKEKLYLNESLLNFLKIHLLKDKIEKKLIIKNIKELKNKI